MHEFEAIGYMKAVVGENDFYMFINEQPQGGFKWTFLDFKPEDDYNYRPIYIRLSPAKDHIEYWKQKNLDDRNLAYEDGKKDAINAIMKAIQGLPNAEEAIKLIEDATKI